MSKQHRGLRLVIALLLILSLLLCGCQNSEPEPQRKAPVSSHKTIERSENSFGARYNFTLGNISKEIAADISNMNITLDNAEWKTISSNLVDDNGVGYSSYCNNDGKVTFTAAVENESGKVMNLGCGCQTSQLDNEAYRSSFVRLAAIIAIHAGGYEKQDMNYFMVLFKTLLNNADETLYYQGTLYFKSVDDKTTVLMVAPCDDKYISENSFVEYRESNNTAEPSGE